MMTVFSNFSKPGVFVLEHHDTKTCQIISASNMLSAISRLLNEITLSSSYIKVPLDSLSIRVIVEEPTSNKRTMWKKRCWDYYKNNGWKAFKTPPSYKEKTLVVEDGFMLCLVGSSNRVIPIETYSHKYLVGKNYVVNL